MLVGSMIRILWITRMSVFILLCLGIRTNMIQDMEASIQSSIHTGTIYIDKPGSR